jgi:2-hydroxychromene-2-carboxylate isomerase
MSLTFDVYWSMRSPYCYLALDRLLELRATYVVEPDVRVIYPIAVRNANFFKTAPKHYRPYHLLDSQRLSEFLNIPYRRPRPDPIVQDMVTNEIAAEQPVIRRLTHLAAAAADAGDGLAFQDQVMRLIWDGRTDGWDQGSHLADAIARAGLDLPALQATIDRDPQRIERIIEANQSGQVAAGHSGVPLFVFRGEPFFGQDRFDVLVWRLQQAGLARRQKAAPRK